VVTKKGTKRNLLITPSPIKGTDRFVLVQRDITELKNLEEKYYESQKLAAIGQLSAGIAHEVRNPLSSIKMSLQILEKRMQPSGNDLKRFKIAQREVEHLEKLVSDVLIYAKPSDPQKEPFDMRSIIERALAMVEKSLKDKDIDVQKIYSEDIDIIFVDPSMIKQALINIFQNAIDAMEPKGKLMISLKNDEQSLVIEIDDNGSGIDEEDLPYVFNPFFTKKNHGTGLGLTQVKKIIDQHNGEIEILSKKGEGTRFIITLPKGDM
jgi:signal transduction histidine kinase